MIHTKKHSWCTIEEGGNWNYEGTCDTHLLYMGNNMYGELIPKSVTHLNMIPNLLLSTPPPPSQQLSFQAENIEDQTHIEVKDQQAIGTELPNLILASPDQGTTHVATSHAAPEESEYNNNLDPMLMQSMNSSKGKICPVHPLCSNTNSQAVNKKWLSTTLAILKHPCNVKLQKLTTLELKNGLSLPRNYLIPPQILHPTVMMTFPLLD